MTKLFHREIFLPAKVRNLRKTCVWLKPTKHAEHEAAHDRYGRVTIPSHVTFSGADIVEIEFTDDRATKFVVRVPYDSVRDAIFVFLPDGTLKTVWTNLKTDVHSTLKRHLYATV